jgi:glutaminase
MFRLGLAEKYDYLLQYMTRIAGGENIGFNNSVFLSERQTADRKMAAMPRYCTQRCVQ